MGNALSDDAEEAYLLGKHGATSATTGTSAGLSDGWETGEGTFESRDDSFGASLTVKASEREGIVDSAQPKGLLGMKNNALTDGGSSAATVDWDTSTEFENRVTKKMHQPSPAQGSEISPLPSAIEKELNAGKNPGGSDLFNIKYATSSVDGDIDTNESGDRYVVDSSREEIFHFVVHHTWRTFSGEEDATEDVETTLVTPDQTEDDEDESWKVETFVEADDTTVGIKYCESTVLELEQDDEEEVIEVMECFEPENHDLAETEALEPDQDNEVETEQGDVIDDIDDVVIRMLGNEDDIEYSDEETNDRIENLMVEDEAIGTANEKNLVDYGERDKANVFKHSSDAVIIRLPAQAATQIAVKEVHILETSIEPGATIERDETSKMKELLLIFAQELAKAMHHNANSLIPQLSPKALDMAIEETSEYEQEHSIAPVAFDEVCGPKGKESITPVSRNINSPMTAKAGSPVSGVTKASASGETDQQSEPREIEAARLPPPATILSLTSEDLEDIDMVFVEQYSKIFDAFLSAHQELVDQDPDFAMFLRVAKLQKLLEEAEGAGAELNKLLESLQRQKAVMTKNYQRELLQSSKEKAGREIELRQELGRIQLASTTLTGKLNWNIVLKHKERADKHMELLQQLWLTETDPENPLATLPNMPETQAIRDAASSPSESNPQLSDEEKEKALWEFQVDNAFLNAEIAVLEMKLAHLKEKGMDHLWVDPLLRRMDLKCLNSLKRQCEKKLGTSF
jgi:hypothetical protein